MDENGEDRISKLPVSVVCHILSRLPTKNAIRTSVLSKDWEHKWTSIYNIQIDDGIESFDSLPRNTENKDFARIVDSVLHLTQNSRIKSFRLTCNTELVSHHVETWTTGVLMRGVQNFEVNAPKWRAILSYTDSYDCSSLKELKLYLKCVLLTSFMKNCFPNLEILCLGREVKLCNDEILYNCWSLKELKLYLNCTLLTSFMKNCFVKLEILCLSHEVKLLNDEISDKVLLNLPVLKELELRGCEWGSVKYVEISAPVLTKFVVEGSYKNLHNDYLIEIDGAKLEKFISGYILENVVLIAPSILDASIISYRGGVALGSRAHAILKGFSTLVHLKLSSEIVKALTEVNTLPCFSRLKQLEISGNISDEALAKVLEVMPSLESLVLFVYNGRGDDIYVRLESLSSGIASRIKEIKFVGYKSARMQKP